MSDADHRCTVLVIDDDHDAQELLRVALAADGYQVASAQNGREALMYLRSTVDTCVIVLDLGLPDMDGMRFRSTQLRDRSLAWIPIVVMSGNVDGPAQARELGARSFVAKPADLDRLRAAIRQVGCGMTRPQREQRKRAVELAGELRAT